MERAQRRAVNLLAALWVAALLLLVQKQGVAGAPAAPPAIPLALLLRGRVHSLAGGQPHLKLPLGCPGPRGLQLGVQHRVPPGQQCAGALSVFADGPQGTMIALWSGEQVRRRCNWLPTCTGRLPLACTPHQACPELGHRRSSSLGGHLGTRIGPATAGVGPACVMGHEEGSFTRALL
jgi:hypothetical protein